MIATNECKSIATGQRLQISQQKRDIGRTTSVDEFLYAKYNQNTPGCIIGIVKDGKLIYNKGFGMANLDYGIPMNPNSVINVMSVSKQFTAACIALLVIDGKISMGDDVHKYIPELPDYSKKITIDHLVRHTSGIRDYADLVFLAGGTPENIAYRSNALEGARLKTRICIQ